DINFNNEVSGSVEVSIVDVYGKTLFTSQENIKAHDIRTFDLNDFASGIYFVRISFGEETQAIRLIKM
ncbi:MAG TPA: T9SS type A sorting domain-containing protein, partial [Bacteroidia bacterium]|nr:T9SS type A sorting domain-containing protein [Bacteroidia bacterium]